MQASNYHDFQLTYVSMGADMVAGHPGEDRRRRRRLADGHRAGDQRHHQERRQHVQGQRRPSLTSPTTGTATTSTTAPTAPGLPAGHRRHADDRLRAPVRRRARRPDHARQGVVLRGAAPRRCRRAASAAPGRGRPHPGLLPRRGAVRQRLRELAAVREGHAASSAATTSRRSTSATACCSPATASTTTSRSRCSRPAARSTAARSPRCGARA